jgi:hypothetical protein
MKNNENVMAANNNKMKIIIMKWKKRIKWEWTEMIMANSNEKPK